MLFLGPSVEHGLTSWLREKLALVDEKEPPKPAFLHLLAPLMLLAPRAEPTFEGEGPMRSGQRVLGGVGPIPPPPFPRWNPGPRPPFGPPGGPPPPPPPPMAHRAPLTAFDVAADLFPMADNPDKFDSPLRYLRAACSSLQSAVFSQLADLITRLGSERLQVLVDGYMRLVPTQEANLLRDVFLRGLFEAPGKFVHLLMPYRNRVGKYFNKILSG